MFEARKQPQLSVEELLHLRWLIGGAMALISIWTLFYLEMSIWPAAILASVMLVTVLLFPKVPGQTPLWLRRLGVPAIVIVFAADVFLHEMVPVFVRLNVLLVCYRVVQYRTRSEDLQLAMLCLFLVVVTGVLTVSLTFAVQILLFTGVSMAFLFVVNLIQDATMGEVVPPAAWVTISRRRLLIRLWQNFDLRLLGLALGLFAAVVSISTVIFLAIPRFQTSNALDWLSMRRGGSLTGFSETIALGESTSISQDRGIAMRVDVAGGGDVPGAAYWRMAVLDEYSKGNFTTSRSILARVGARSIPAIDFTPRRVDPRQVAARGDAGRDVTFTVFLEGGVSRFLPNPGTFKGLRFKDLQDIVENDVLGVYATERQSSVLVSYQILGADLSGVIADPGFPEARQAYPRGRGFRDASREATAVSQPGEYPATTLEVPVAERDAAYLEALVRRILEGRELTNAAKANLICDYLARSHRYTLSVSLAADEVLEDPVVRWLNGRMGGHCEFFASAFALLARTAGIPTRVVTGFRGGTWNGFENYYMVRNSDAHAWCEIFDGEEAWLRVDPTPGGAVTTRDVSEVVAVPATDHTFTAYADSLRMVWYRRIVSFDQRSQRSVAESIRGVGGELALWGDAAVATVRAEYDAWRRQGWSWQSKGDILCLTTMIFCVAVLMKQFGIGTGDVLEWIRTGERPTRRRAGELLARVRAKLEEPPRRGRWDRERAERVAQALAVIRFGRPKDWPRPRRVFREARSLI